MPCTISLIHRGAQHKLVTLAGRRHVITLERRPRAGVGHHASRRPLPDPGADALHRHFLQLLQDLPDQQARCAAFSPVQRRSFERSSASGSARLEFSGTPLPEVRGWRPPRTAARPSPENNRSAGGVCCSYASSRSRITASLVVVPDDQRCAVQIAHTRHLGRLGNRRCTGCRTRGHCRRPVRRAIIIL